MRRRLITSLAAALVALPFCALPASAALLIQIDKSAQRMTVSQDGELLYVWPVSTGRAGLNTPSGTFKPFRMEIDHYSEQYDNAPMPHSIFFTRTGDAIHGTFEEKWLGNAVSHGCVRLSRKNAAILWKLVKHEKMANTQVMLSGQIPRGAPLVAQDATKNDDVTASVAPRYQRRWTNDDATYGGGGYYDDRPLPPPPGYARERRWTNGDGFGDGPLPFPFSLFGR